ncbi:MAG: hypothetical protein KAS93_06600 [Gammaproteobacteria bacterium]|nr:hypothetical protein [Gammaproteobacteria bacterium]
MSKTYGPNIGYVGSPIYGRGGIRSGSPVHDDLASIPFKLAKSNITATTQDKGTLVRATTAIVKDHENVLREVNSGELRFQGQRRVENLLDDTEDFSTGNWTFGGTGSITGVNILNLPAVNDSIIQTLSGNSANTNMVGLWMLSGTGTITIDMSNFSDSSASLQVTLSSTPTLFTLSNSFTSTVGNVRFRLKRASGDTATEVTMQYVQLQDKTGSSDPSVPDGYISKGVVSSPWHGAGADGVQYFNFEYYDGIDCWGDSMIGQGSPISFYTRMEIAYGNGYNNGVGGETSTEIKDRFIVNSDQDNRLILIWAGRNNFSSPTTVKADIATMVAAIPHNDYVIVSILNSDTALEYSGEANYDIIVQLNNDLESLYPNNYIDVRSPLVSAYDPEVPQDVIDFGRDVPPSSLRGDTIHLNGDGALLASQVIWSFIQSKGMESANLITGSIGDLTEPQRANKCTNYNANPDSGLTNIAVGSGAGTFSRADDSTALAVAGLDAICTDGNAFKFVAAADSVIEISGQTGNTNTHTASIWARIDTGTGELRIAAAKAADITSTDYAKVSGTLTPAASANIIKLFIPNGSTMYFVLNQLEEAVSVSSEIITEGSTAPRNADVLPYPSTYIPANGAFKFKLTLTAASQGAISICGAGSASTDRVSIIHDGTNLVIRKRLSSVDYDATKALAYVADTTYIIKGRIDDENGVDLWIEDVKGTGDSNTDSPDFGSALYVGSDYDGSGQITGGIDELTWYSGHLTDSEMVAL